VGSFELCLKTKAIEEIREFCAVLQSDADWIDNYRSELEAANDCDFSHLINSFTTLEYNSPFIECMEKLDCLACFLKKARLKQKDIKEIHRRLVNDFLNSQKNYFH